MLGSVRRSMDTKSREKSGPPSCRGQQQGLSSLFPQRTLFAALHLPFSLTRLTAAWCQGCVSHRCVHSPQAPCLARRKCPVNICWIECSRAWKRPMCRKMISSFIIRPLLCLIQWRGICDVAPVQATRWQSLLADCSPGVCSGALVLKLALLILESFKNLGLTFIK